MPLITHCLCNGTAIIPLFFPRLLPIVAVLLVNARHAFEQIIIRYATRRTKGVIRSLPVIFLPPYYDFFPSGEKERKNEGDWRILFVRRKWRTTRRNTRVQLEIHCSLNCRPNVFISILITRTCVNAKAREIREHCVRVILHARRTRILFVF